MDAGAIAEVAVHRRYLSGRNSRRRRRASDRPAPRGVRSHGRAIFTREFDGRILPFDTQAASAYADIFADRRQMGRPIATADLIVAATARAHDAAVVTRDSGGFEGCGVTLVKPWDA